MIFAWRNSHDKFGWALLVGAAACFVAMLVSKFPVGSLFALLCLLLSSTGYLLTVQGDTEAGEPFCRPRLALFCIGFALLLFLGPMTFLIS